MGATSAIAEATARGSRAAPTRCFSSDANAGRLQAIADDLKLRGAVTVGTQVHDARDVPGYEALLRRRRRSAAWTRR
jgi:decaprenylphospho-beta-D-erythro-pentofuranosid-2-ulose 2-reductase